MKIEFEDKSYIEVVKSSTPNKVVISIQAKDYENPLKKITNSVEITKEQFQSFLDQILNDNN